MTVIVGYKDDRGVWIGGDAQGTGGHEYHTRRDPKVFCNGPMILGYTSSFRMGQVLQYSLSIPPRTQGQSAMAYMCTAFVDAVRRALKDAGYTKIESNREEGGVFIIGYEGDLFYMDDDFQIGRPVLPYTAVGSGAQMALGAMHCLVGSGDADAIVRKAMQAAEAHNVTVRGPYTVVFQPKGEGDG